jgi:CRP/FNR family cyclic AMP-dependent transcriptional regulator
MHNIIDGGRSPGSPHLRTHYIVAGLSDADMIWLLSMGKLRNLKPGDPLVTAGRAVHDLFFVTRGSFAVTLKDGAHIATLKNGDVVGEMSFIERHPPSASVRAVDKAEVLGIPREAILARFEQEPDFAARFYCALATFLSERLRETTAAVQSAQDLEDTQKAADASSARFTNLFRKILN